MSIKLNKTSFSRLLRKKSVLISIAVIAIIVILYFIFSGTKKPTFETAKATIGNIIEKVSVTGKVVAYQKADLGFEKGGTISKINVKVGDQVKEGDIIAMLDSSDTLASLQGAQANLLAENARLSELEKGLRPEELSVEDSKLKSSQISLDDARTGVITALHDSYIKSENSILNYIGVFFINSQSVAPRINIHTDSYAQENSINTLRVTVTDKLISWKQDLDSLTLSTSTDPSIYLNKVHAYLESIKTFMSQLSFIISTVNTGNSGLSQTIIDSYNVTMNTAFSIFNTAVNSIATAEANYKNVLSTSLVSMDQYNLKKAGSSIEAVQIQKAKVAQAQSNVSLYYSELKKKSVIAPFQGVLTKSLPEVGEFVQAGQVSFAVISDKSFKIEANIPEADIAKISSKNKADVTLDSYGQYVIFPATVVFVDPAETIIDGVATYKVTLEFDSPDTRIRSGMTANTDILTHEVNDVLTVPSRAIVDDNGKKTIRIIDSNGKTYTSFPVEVGLKGSDGTTEIISGVTLGQKVVTYVK